MGDGVSVIEADVASAKIMMPLWGPFCIRVSL